MSIETNPPQSVNAKIDGVEPSKPTATAQIAGLLLTFCVMLPLSALLTTWASGLLWHWHLESQYGPGPKPIAWYGITLLVGLIVKVKDFDKAANNPNPLLTAFKTMFHTATFIGLTLAVSCFVRALLWT